MIQVKLQKDIDYTGFAETCRCGAVYPLSIAQSYQAGDLFIDSEESRRAVLFWHNCGFAFLGGQYVDALLESVYDLLLNKDGTNPRRFVLFAADPCMEAFFRGKAGLQMDLRSFYTYPAKETEEALPLPDGFALQAIDVAILSKIEGRITPRFSWTDMDAFLTKGKGYCLMEGDRPVAWAFSAAVSDREIDIGVETAEPYRGRGLAAIVSKAMIRYALSQNKTPVWACHCSNIASGKLAEKLGFEKIAQCYVIKKK